MLFHSVLPMRARTDCSARNRCTFTVPSFIPVAAAISSRSMSSTNRSKKTVRCLAGKLSDAFQTARSCSLASALASGEVFPSRTASKSTSACWVRFRSEEHTSELQSHLNLVCRLLLEKKKKNSCHSYFLFIPLMCLHTAFHLR